MIARLAKAIGYPQEVPAEAGSFDFIVDGEAISAEAEVRGLGAGRILLKTVLTEDEDVACRLATYAAGRLLKEDAVLAWDPEKRAVILWKEVKGLGAIERSETAGGLREQRRAFESFCVSADWWRDRVAEENPGHAGVSEMMIRP